MNSTPLAIRFAFLAAIAAASLAVVLLLLAALLRLLLVHRAARNVRSIQRWQGILLQGTERIGLLPRIPRSDRVGVLVLWNHLYESVRGPMQERLRDVAPRACIDEIAMQLLERGRRPARLLAITTAGNLGLRDAWDFLVPMLKEGGPTVSAAAARALVRIDPEAAIAFVAPALAERADWHPARIAPVITEAGDGLARALAMRVRTAHAPDQVRLIRLLEATKNREALPVIRETLASTTDAELVATCIRALADFNDPRDLRVVRTRLDHETSFVRVQAAAALGRLGVRDDEQRLVRLLTDREWWVRYRAAQSLVAMPFVSSDHLKRIASGHVDRYARDALTHALAEAGAL